MLGACQKLWSKEILNTRRENWMGKFCSGLSVLLLMTSVIFAGTTFTFDDGLVPGQMDGVLLNQHPVSDYLTAGYGCTISARGMSVNQGLWQGNDSQYISTHGFTGRAFDIYFGQTDYSLCQGNFLSNPGAPINSVSFDWYVFNPTTGADFTFRAYDADGNFVKEAVRELEDNSYWIFSDDLVDEFHWFTHGGGGSICFEFDTPVYQIQFSDNGIHDVGIDNLILECAPAVVPSPGALVLCSIGLLGIGTVRKRFMR
jgi:hypothetical protein